MAREYHKKAEKDVAVRWHKHNKTWIVTIGYHISKGVRRKKDWVYSGDEMEARKRATIIKEAWNRNKYLGHDYWHESILLELQTLGLYKAKRNEDKAIMVKQAELAAERFQLLIKKPDMASCLLEDGTVDRTRMPDFYLQNIYDIMCDQKIVEKFRRDVIKRIMQGDSFEFWREIVGLNGGPVPLLGDGKATNNSIPQINFFVQDKEALNIIETKPRTEDADYWDTSKGEDGKTKG